jgi:hypothetical protein
MQQLDVMPSAASSGDVSTFEYTTRPQTRLSLPQSQSHWALATGTLHSPTAALQTARRRIERVAPCKDRGRRGAMLKGLCAVGVLQIGLRIVFEMIMSDLLRNELRSSPGNAKMEAVSDGLSLVRRS